MPGTWASLALASVILLAAVALPFILNNSDFACWICSICHPFLCPAKQSGHHHHSQTTHQNVHQFRIDSLDSIGASSVWCSGSQNCRFEWLCLKRDSDEYVFAFDEQRSVFYPAKLRFDDGQVEYGRLSSVAEHNLYSFKHLVTVPRLELAAILGHSTAFLIPGRTLIASRFKPDNWMHLLHDDILPLFATIRQLGLDTALEHVFLDDNWNHRLGWHMMQSLFPNPIAKSHFPRDSLVCFENAFIGLSNATVWYQYGFVRLQGAVERTEEELIYIRGIIRSFRARLVSAFQLSDCPTARHSLLLVRSQNRRIINSADLFNHLLSRFDNLRLVILDKHSLSDVSRVRQLLQAFLCARTVIGLHGSELVLSILMAPSEVTSSSETATMLELFPYGIEPGHYTPFRSLATILGHRYYAWRNELRQNAVFPDQLNHPAQWGGLSHLGEKERRSIVESVDQPLQAHLCCDNPAWLYRIYQDTRVDLASFDELLNSLASEQPQISSRTNNKSPLDLFRLSDVSNLRCSWSSSTVTISWQSPWNLPLCCVDATYEVLIQKVHSKEALVVTTAGTQLPLPSDHCGSLGCNVWVKAMATHRNAQYHRAIGFFSTSPLECIADNTVDH